MDRHILLVNAMARRWRLETIHVETAPKDPRHDYLFFSGEALCQYLLRRDTGAMVIARGPMPFLAGNKASVGYLSPLTGLPHYSFVGGRTAAQLLNLGLDAICFESSGQTTSRAIVVVSGRAPRLSVEFRESGEIPSGQRAAYYRLLERELGGDAFAGSILTLGEAAFLGYRSANLAADAIYHAGRGGAGHVMARFAAALVLRGEPIESAAYLAGAEPSFARNPNAVVAPLLARHCARLSGKAGGTITKLFTTGADPAGKNTLPAANARQLGYALADLGSPRLLQATRRGHTGCHWCQVDCRHWHWVPADYAPGGRDIFLDDFEPTYALFAMLGLEPLGLEPDRDSRSTHLALLADVNRRLILPVEQMGIDVIDLGVGLAALQEGLQAGLIPPDDVPAFLSQGGLSPLEAAVQAVTALCSGEADAYPALRALGDGPQALAERYPPMQETVFTCGKGTLGNAGHCNALWTFLMPFSRFFGHYSGQFYKVEEELPPPGATPEEYRACFERVVSRLLQRETFWLIGNALSMCAFTFVIFSQDGKGERLSDDDFLVHLLQRYGLPARRADLEWFAQSFWAQSIGWKCALGWRPPRAAGLPGRVYQALSLALGRPAEELRGLMDMLIEEWKRQAGEVMGRFGYGTPW